LRPNYFKLQKEEVLTFDRDEKRNPFNEASLSELEANLIARPGPTDFTQYRSAGFVLDRKRVQHHFDSDRR
jgi:hypothetical protein